MPDRLGHFHRHRFPAEIISHAVWLYYRFPLSHRDVEELLAERGIQVSYETVRRRAIKFGVLFAEKLRRREARCAQWHDCLCGTGTRVGNLGLGSGEGASLEVHQLQDAGSQHSRLLCRHRRTYRRRYCRYILPTCRAAHRATTYPTTARCGRRYGVLTSLQCTTRFLKQVPRQSPRLAVPLKASPPRLKSPAVFTLIRFPTAGRRRPARRVVIRSTH
jgi:hypothetical protein